MHFCRQARVQACAHASTIHIQTNTTVCSRAKCVYSNRNTKRQKQECICAHTLEMHTETQTHSPLSIITPDKHAAVSALAQSRDTQTLSVFTHFNTRRASRLVCSHKAPTLADTHTRLSSLTITPEKYAAVSVYNITKTLASLRSLNRKKSPTCKEDAAMT